MSERRGWVAVHRVLLDSSVWRLPDGQRIVFLAVLLLANHAEKNWIWRGKNFAAGPGQLVTSSEQLATVAGVSRQTVRTALKNLAQLGVLTSESTSTGMLITLINWGSYQSGGQQSTSELTNDQPATTDQPANQPADNKKSTNTLTNQSTSVETLGTLTDSGVRQADGQQSTSESTSELTNDQQKINRRSTTNNNDNNDVQKKLTTDGGGCDDLAIIIGQDAAHRWLTERGTAYCQAQLDELTRQGKKVRDPATWLPLALMNNWARWQPPPPPSPRPGPNCPHCNGTGRRTDWGVYPPKTLICTCVPRPASAVQESSTPAPAAAPDDPDHRDTASLTARVTADLTP